MDSTLVKLIENVTLQSVDLIKTNAPLLWEMTKHRIFVLAIGRLVMAGILTIFVVFCGVCIGKKEEYLNNETLIPILFVAAIIAIFFAYFGILPLCTLDYATAEKIISLIR